MRASKGGFAGSEPDGALLPASPQDWIAPAKPALERL